jgi:hypothetical protein
MNIEQALTNPASVFSSPDEVIRKQTLSRDQKIRILRRWKYDALELEVAEEENMAGGPPGVLDQVLKALHRLDAKTDLDHSPPTKHGGD